MTAVTTLQTQDSSLRQQYDTDPETITAAQLNAFLKRVQQTGQTTGSIQQREKLLEILHFWAPIVEDKTGDRIDITLASYDPEAQPDDKETAVLSTSYIEAANGSLEGANMSEQSQDDQPQTVAQLFMTLSTPVKVGILLVIALILAGILYWILSLSSDETEIDTSATETVVSAAITASAQPTGTATPTATPPIYIESEAPAAGAAPIGSPTPIIYIVQSGDTLNKVARLYGVAVQDIATLNNIYNADNIAVGQELLIPAASSNTNTSPPTETTPLPQTGEANPNPPQTNETSHQMPELVIKGIDLVDLRIAAGPDYQAITSLPQGTFATIIAKTPDGNWYLIQLEDGYTRGWVEANFTALISPADPNNIPTTPVP
jgi:LysM repeat protein